MAYGFNKKKFLPLRGKLPVVSRDEVRVDADTDFELLVQALVLGAGTSFYGRGRAVMSVELCRSRAAEMLAQAILKKRQVESKENIVSSGKIRISKGSFEKILQGEDFTSDFCIAINVGMPKGARELDGEERRSIVPALAQNAKQLSQLGYVGFSTEAEHEFEFEVDGTFHIYYRPECMEKCSTSSGLGLGAGMYGAGGENGFEGRARSFGSSI
jgi:hypothetical protein